MSTSTQVQRYEVINWLGDAELYGDCALRDAIADAIVESGSTVEGDWLAIMEREHAARTIVVTADVRYDMHMVGIRSPRDLDPEGWDEEAEDEWQAALQEYADAWCAAAIRIGRERGYDTSALVVDQDSERAHKIDVRTELAGLTEVATDIYQAACDATPLPAGWDR